MRTDQGSSQESMMRRVEAAPRPMIAAPSQFDGELPELFAYSIEPNLPTWDEVEHLHRVLIDYCRRADPVFIVRFVGGLERGKVYATASGDRLKPSDNAPAWWMHFVAFNRIRDVDLSQMPTQMFEVQKALPTSINTAGWHIAHILNAKDRNTDWRNWSRHELARRFIRNVHRCNYFYIPKAGWQQYGGDAGGRVAHSR